MRKLALVVAVVAGCGGKAAPPLQHYDEPAAPFSTVLRDDWRLRSSADVHADPLTVSTLTREHSVARCSTY